jgi:hypothetical protein
MSSGVRWITWVAVLAPLPYSLSRVLWALGVPVGIHEKGLDEIGVPSVGMSAYVLALAVGSAMVGAATYQIALRGRRTLPGFLPFFGGGRVPHFALIVPAALISVFLLSAFFAAEHAPKLFTDPDDFRRSVAPEGWAPAWAFWAQEAVFGVWGASLAIATFTYWHRARAARSREPAIA